MPLVLLKFMALGHITSCIATGHAVHKTRQQLTRSNLVHTSSMSMSGVRGGGHSTRRACDTWRRTHDAEHAQEHAHTQHLSSYYQSLADTHMSAATRLLPVSVGARELVGCTTRRLQPPAGQLASAV